MKFKSMKTKSAVVVAAVGLLSLGGAAVASAASHPSPAQTANVTYHGCLDDHTRTIEDVYTTRTPTCGSGSEAVTWNEQGPKGDTGAAGPRGATGPTGPAGPQGAVDLYDSTVPQGIYSQSPDWLTQIGDAVNLTSNPAGADLRTVNVGLIICSGGCSDTTDGLAASTASVTVTLYDVGVGGTVGSQIASVTDSDVSVPAVPVGTTQVAFTVPFNFSSQHLDLPSDIVYGITVNSNSTGNLNVGLAPSSSAGSVLYPGDVYLATTSSDLAALTSDIGTCTGNNLASDPTTFQPVPVGCSSGYGANTEATAEVVMNGNDGTYNGNTSDDPDYQGTDEIPVVQFLTTG